MTTILYRLARRDPWTGRYRFAGIALSLGAMENFARDIFSEMRGMTQGEYEYIVIAGTTEDRLEKLLENLNTKGTTVGMSLRRFIKRGFIADTVPDAEAALLGLDPPKDSALAALIKEVDGKFIKGVDIKLLCEDNQTDPTPDPTTEEEAEDDDEPPQEAGPMKFKHRKPRGWTEREMNRLRFIRWMVETGRLTDHPVEL